MLSQVRITFVTTKPARPAANDPCPPSSPRLEAIKAALRDQLIATGMMSR